MKLLTLLRMVLHPIAFAIGALGVGFIVAATTIGGWYDDAMNTAGLKNPPGWIPSLLGVGSYVLLGILLPAVLFYQLVGIAGVALGPFLSFGVIALLGNWFSRKLPRNMRNS